MTNAKDERRLPLEGLRVLDWAGANAPHCGQILSLFGADVVLADTPASRPTGDDIAWAAFNAGKRSLVVDPDSAEGRERVETLARSADVWIDEGPPICDIDPRVGDRELIHVSVTPFGLTGPRAHWKDSELVAQAAGGIHYLSGDGDHPPARVGIALATGMAGAQAACAAMLALAQRVRTGVGARIDVSRQESVANLLFTTQFMSMVSQQPGRRGDAPLTASGKQLTRKVLWEAADGYVTWTLWTGRGLGLKNAATFAWMRESGIGEVDELLEIPWQTMSTGDLTPELIDQVNTLVGGFFRSLTKEEIDRQALARRILLAGVKTPEELADDEQLRARDAYRQLTLPDTRRVKIVGTPLRSTAYTVEIGERSPVPGSDTADVAAEWTERKSIARAAESAAVGSPPLAGIRVLDLGWAVVSPLTTKYLALFGADVAKIEFRGRPDPVRMTGPYPKGRPSFDGSSTFVSINACKKGLGIDLAHPDANALVMRLARGADIVCENFAPGTAARLGYDEAAFRAVREDLIMLSISMQGQTGPRAPHPGLGNHLQAISGIDHLSGHPDGLPCGPNQVLPDFIGAWIAIASLLAALEHRRVTGEGQFIDLSQLEAIMLYLQPSLIDFDLTGVCPQRMGNRSPFAAPHGVYPVVGEDRWIAIAVANDADWRALHALLPAALRSSFAANLDTAARLARADELDTALAGWTSGIKGEALMESLQGARVAAYTVSDGMQLTSDPQMLAREHYRPVENAKLGQQWVDAPSFRIDNLEPRIETNPLYAEHTVEVLQEWGGLGDDEVAELVAKEVLVF